MTGRNCAATLHGASVLLHLLRNRTSAHIRALSIDALRYQRMSVFDCLHRLSFRNRLLKGVGFFWAYISKNVRGIAAARIARVKFLRVRIVLVRFYGGGINGGVSFGNPGIVFHRSCDLSAKRYVRL